MSDTQRAAQAGSNAAALQIERLLDYARKCRIIDALDVYAARNALLDLFQLAEPAAERPEWDGQPVHELLEPLVQYGHTIGLIPELTVTYQDLLDTRIIGLLMPRPSEVVREFRSVQERDGIEKATSEFYQLNIDSNYIRMDRVNKNVTWLQPTEYGKLQMTINLSKPEKDPREIALLKTMKSTHYPKCLLCSENAGYAGRLNHPARQNLRTIPLVLTGEPWSLQYSPYVYYNEHCIVFHQDHVPMKLTENTFRRLLQFVDHFPHYFIGSNADLPIVGGSILDHDHFQGGRHRFPIQDAPAEMIFTHPAYKGVRGSIVRWPMSVLRLASLDQQALLSAASDMFEQWKQYSDEAADIFAYSEQDGNLVPHNTVTPIVRKNDSGEYEIDLVLRNNRQSEAHPEGIFHPHRHLHHIKKENIGLIEVMGLAVLPGRLKEELSAIASILSGDKAWAAGHDETLLKHEVWIRSLLGTYGTSLTQEQAAAALLDETGRKFQLVLEDAGVYKTTDAGRAKFRHFVLSTGFLSVE